jgi:hypothetical protein
LKDPEQAKIIYPEMARNTILFGGTDPGRFCPTYAIFCDSFIPHSCQPLQDQKFDRRDCYLITQNALADGTYLDYLRSQYFRSAQHDPPFFSELSKYIFGLFLGPDSADGGFFGAINKTLYYTLAAPRAFIRPAKFTSRRRMIHRKPLNPTRRTWPGVPNTTRTSRTNPSKSVPARMSTLKAARCRFPARWR